MRPTLRLAPALALALLLAWQLLPGFDPQPAPLPTRPHAHAADPNDHGAMYSGGIPGYDEPLAMTEIEYCDERTGECFKEAGLGFSAPSRSYLDEPSLDVTVYATSDGDPVTGLPDCHARHKDTKEVGVFFIYDPNVTITGARSPHPNAPKDGCVSWHAQADPNFIGRRANEVGRDGTGRRAATAGKHGMVIMSQNPLYGVPGQPYVGRYLVREFSGVTTFEVALSGGNHDPPATINDVIGTDVWYAKNITRESEKAIGARASDGHISGWGVGQTRTPIRGTMYTRPDGRPQMSMSMNGDGGISLDSCNRPQFRRAGDEGIPCFKVFIEAGRGSLTGESTFNPNLFTVPHDRFGNRLLPLSYGWVKCPEDQAGIVQPMTKDAEGANLNPHQWDIRSPARTLPYQRPECSYTSPVSQGLVGVNPPEGFIGVPNTAPAPEPTGVVPATATIEPTAQTPATATAQAQPRRVPLPVDTIHWWTSSDALDLPERPAPAIVQTGVTGGVFYDWGRGAPREGIGADDFAAVFYGTWAGPISALRVRSDDGVRVFINDVLEFDGWDNPPYGTVEVPIVHVDDAPVPVRVEYREITGAALVRVEAVTTGGGASAPATPTPPVEPTATPADTPTPEPTATETPEPPTPTATEDDRPPLATPQASTTQRLISTEPLVLSNVHFEWKPNPECRGGATRITDEAFSFNYGDTAPPGMPQSGGWCVLARTHLEVQRGRRLDQLIIRADDAIRVVVGRQMVLDTITSGVNGPYREVVIDRMPDGRLLRDVYGPGNHEVHIVYVQHGGRALAWVFARSF